MYHHVMWLLIYVRTLFDLTRLTVTQSRKAYKFYCASAAVAAVAAAAAAELAAEAVVVNNTTTPLITLIPN